MGKKNGASKPRSNVTIYKGDVFTSKYGECVVLRYVTALRIKIKFTATGFVTYCCASTLRSGTVKDKLHPTVLGVGCFGDGPYQTSHKINGRQIRTKHYALWQSMLYRCYSDQPKFVSGYAGCSVAKRWHNFQNFAHDIEQMDNWNTPGFQLDKDIIKPGNKRYGPKTCCFVPAEINAALIRQGTAAGVTQVSENSWRARLSNVRKNMRRTEEIGCFPTETEARQAYAKAKRRRVRKLATKYQDQLDPRAYKALRRYKIQEAAS